MPLIHSKSPEAFKTNLKTEMKAGKPMKQSLAIAYAMKKKPKKMSEGGEMASGYLSMPEDHEKDNEAADKETAFGADMIDRIMRKRYSEGGVVANEGEDEMSHLADGRPNEFDDLALDDHLEGHNSGAEAGDDLGDHQEDMDRSDIVARVMRSRAKKDRMPRPA